MSSARRGPCRAGASDLARVVSWEGGNEEGGGLPAFVLPNAPREDPRAQGGNTMGRSIRFVMLTALAVTPLLAATPAEAQRRDRDPVIRNVDVDIDRDGDLEIEFRELGLDRRDSVEIRLSAEVRAVYRCATRAGVVTGGQGDRRILRQRVTEREVFRADREGRLSASIELEAPETRNFCPRDRYPVLVRVTYDDVVLRDATNGVIVRVDGRYNERIGNRFNPHTVFDRRDDNGRPGDRFRIQ